MMKRVKYQINDAERFDKKCFAEIFGMLQSGRCEFVRGNVCLEVHSQKGKDNYTLWRLDADGEFYEVEMKKTYDANAVAEHLYMIREYESIGWDVPWDSVKQVLPLLAGFEV